MRITGDKRHSYFHYKRGYIAMVDGVITGCDPNNMIFEAKQDTLRWKQHPHHDVEMDPKIAQEIIDTVIRQQSEKEQRDSDNKYQGGITITFI